MVYEGYQVDDYTSHRHTPSLRVDETANGSFMDNMVSHGSDACCYDADTSNNSADYNLSAHEEVSQAALHRSFGEAAARGAKNTTGFYPVNEDTVFMEHPSHHGLMSGHHRVVTQSADNWMLYGNSNSSSSSDSSSGDEYCCGQHTVVNSEDTSSDLDIGMLPIGAECPLKRNRQQLHRHHRLRLYEEEPGEGDDDEDEDDCASLSKRIKVKTTTGNTQPNLVPNPEDSLVDVRMIDFAHTTFGHNHGLSTTLGSNSNSTLHQGPDCGFLTGLDSLKRLLLEIQAEG